MWLSCEPNNDHLIEFSCAPFAKRSAQLGLLTVYTLSQRGREGHKTLTCVCSPEYTAALYPLLICYTALIPRGLGDFLAYIG